MRDAEERRRPRFVTPGRFAGKVVLVTGAAQGIGECTARRIAAEGGTLVLADRAEHVHELADELAGDGSEESTSIGVTADLETWEGASVVVDARDRTVRTHRRRHPHRGRHDLGQAVRALPARADPGRDQPVAVADAVVLPRGRPAHGRAGRRDDRERLLGGHPRPEPAPVRGGEGRGQRDHRGAGAGDGAARCPGRRDRPRWHGRPAATDPARPCPAG
ncbi:hypothetical protein L7F22_032967 [Adiantum nelumboides]|nr:hypothetical protein [Adiantum nelumboides]